MKEYSKREYIEDLDIYKQDFVYDVPEELSNFSDMSPKFERKGYTFEGWSRTPDGISAEFKNEAEVLNLTSKDNATIDLYAVWKNNKYVIQYNPNGSINGAYYQTAFYDEPFELDPNEFLSSSSFRFVGWSTYENLEHIADKIYEEEDYITEEFIYLDKSYIDNNNLVPKEFNGDVTNLFPIFIKKEIFEYRNASLDSDLDSDNSDFSSDLNKISSKTNVIISGLTEFGKTLSSFSVFTYNENLQIIGIDENAFSNNSLLKHVDFPNDSKISFIGKSAFKNCVHLNSVLNLPNSLTCINESAFENCEKLIDITFNNNDNETSKNKLNSIDEIQFIKKELDINEVGETETEEDTNEEEDEESVYIIGDNAFKNCSNIKNISIPNRFKKIGNNSFEKCSHLANINLPDELESIGDNSFAYCEDLEFIEIPSAISSIGINVFLDCFALRYIDVKKDFDNELFKNIISDKTFCRVLANSKKLEIFNFSNENPDIISSLTEYGQCLETIYIPNNIISISDNCFLNNKVIKNIVISEKSLLSYFGEKSFKDCSNLENIYFPKTLKNIGLNAFENCEKLTTIYHNCNMDNTTIIGVTNLPSDKEYKLVSNSLQFFNFLEKTLEDNSNIYLISSLTFPGKTRCEMLIENTSNDKSIVGFEKYALYNEQFIEKLEIDVNDFRILDIGVFKEAINLKEIIFPENNKIERFEKLVFYNCESLTQINSNTLKSLQYVAPYSFGNSNIEYFIFSEKFNELMSFVFDNCKNLRNVRFLTNNVKYIHDNSFNECSELEIIYFYNISDMENYYKWGAKNIEIQKIENSLSSIFEKMKYSSLFAYDVKYTDENGKSYAYNIKNNGDLSKYPSFRQGYKTELSSALKFIEDSNATFVHLNVSFNDRRSDEWYSIYNGCNFGKHITGYFIPLWAYNLKTETHTYANEVYVKSSIKSNVSYMKDRIKEIRFNGKHNLPIALWILDWYEISFNHYFHQFFLNKTFNPAYEEIDVVDEYLNDLYGENGDGILQYADVICIGSNINKCTNYIDCEYLCYRIKNFFRKKGLNKNIPIGIHTSFNALYNENKDNIRNFGRIGDFYILDPKNSFNNTSFGNKGDISYTISSYTFEDYKIPTASNDLYDKLNTDAGKSALSTMISNAKEWTGKPVLVWRMSNKPNHSLCELALSAGAMGVVNWWPDDSCYSI